MQGDHRGYQAGGREAIDVVNSLDQRKKSNVSLSQVINGLKAEAKARKLKEWADLKFMYRVKKPHDCWGSSEKEGFTYI
jgi:hypothetical protein